VKRKEFIKELVEAGCYLKRHGSKHDIYVNPKSGRMALFQGMLKSEILFVN